MALEDEQNPQIQPPNLETLTIADPLSPGTWNSFSDLCFEIDSLQDLAFRGSWKSILDKVSRARKLNLLQKSHEHLIYLTYNTLALIKLKKFPQALEEIDSLEDLDSIKYHYETYPQQYPKRSGSMIPFGLRWIYADLPQRLGKRQETLDRLYLLLGFVREKLKKKSETEKSDFSGDLWKKREIFVINSIISNHLGHKEFIVCLALIKDLIARNPSDPVLVSKLGHVQLQVGDLDGARSTFARVESMENLGELAEKKEFKNLVNRNKALVCIVSKDYVSAVREYEECIERDPADVVAINNKALCLMYLRDLSDSIKVLESALERVPTVALNETLVVNLCSMYELAYVNHGEVKKNLNNWIARVAPDDFDSSCTRI